MRISISGLFFKACDNAELIFTEDDGIKSLSTTVKNFFDMAYDKNKADSDWALEHGLEIKTTFAKEQVKQRINSPENVADFEWEKKLVRIINHQAKAIQLFTGLEEGKE